MADTMKFIKSFEESGILIKVVIESIENEAKKQKGGFLSIFLGTLDTSLLGNLLAGKGVMKICEDTIRGGQDLSCQLVL